MKIVTRIKREVITSAPASFLVRKSKKVILPGFQGIPLFDVVRFFLTQIKKTSITERASAIAFNFTMAIPPTIIFMFTLIPYLPISNQFIQQLFALIRDVVPGEEDNQGVITFLSDILNKPRTGLLSTGFILALFFSSNAMMGIMRSFDKNYVGFRKRKGFQQRTIALRLTFILLILFFLTVTLLAMQGAVLRWLGITNETVIALIRSLRWIFIIALILLSISFIYRYGPAVHKRWKLINPGSIVAAFLMIAFTAGFSFWVSNFSNYNELYGSISTVLILMLLIYFNSLVLLIGFELNVSINSLKYEVDERNKNLTTGHHSA